MCYKINKKVTFGSKWFLFPSNGLHASVNYAHLFLMQPNLSLLIFFKLHSTNAASVYFYSNNILGFIPKPILLLISAILLLPFVLVSISSALGSALLKWDRRIRLLFLLLFMYLLPHVFILSEDRFHLALIPYLSILAAYFWANGIQSFSTRWVESNYGKLSIFLAVFAVLLLLLNWRAELVRDADKITALLGQNGNTTYFPY